VITTPLTAETERLVSADALAALPNGALVVNAGRGRIVDTDALVDEVQTGRLRAALDVTDPEPLPADHPLWTVPGVIISPHSARTVPGTNELCYQVAADQIGQLLAGRTPTNAVPGRVS
jgi:phosphoglycerate dehydrogenase-like enzyme